MLADLLSESYDGDLEESWENERTATPIRAFASASTKLVIRFVRQLEFSQK